MKRIWRLRCHSLHFRCWDDVAVIFNAENCDTHSISLLAYELLNLLGRLEQATASRLVKELADVFEGDDHQVYLELVEGALLQLRDIELVTCTQS